jgi:hypothetical protein
MSVEGLEKTWRASEIDQQVFTWKKSQCLKSVDEWCGSSGGDEIDSVEAKRSPLSPNFNLCRRGSRKLGDNSDRKNDS